MKPLGNQNGDHLEFEDILTLKPTNFILQSNTNDKIEFQQDYPYTYNGKCIEKNVSFNINGTFEVFIGARPDKCRLSLSAKCKPCFICIVNSWPISYMQLNVS